MVKDLWSHVEGRSEDCLCLFVLLSKEFSETEVGNFDDTVMLEYVGKFEIAVHDFVFEESLKAMKNLNEILNCFFFRENFLFFEVGP